MHEITCWRFSRAVADIITLLIPYFINFRGDELLRDKFTYCSPLNSYVNILVLRDKQSLREGKETKENEGRDGWKNGDAEELESEETTVSDGTGAKRVGGRDCPRRRSPVK